MAQTIDPITAADRPERFSKSRWLVPHPSTFKNYTCCPWATSVIMRDPETDHPMLAPVTCKRWGCSYCAPRKIRKLAFLTRGANPNRWIRLGVDPSLYESPEQAWRKTSPQVPELFRILRKDNQEYEYLRVAELHQATTRYSELPAEYKANGFPHYHCLIRSPYIPQKKLSDEWARLTSAPVVWIAKIHQTFSSFRYLTKYLTKLHRIEWTDRHVSYSKNFFREEDREKLAFPERTILERSEDHPWKWLADHYPDEQVALDDTGFFFLPHPPGKQEVDTPLHAFGLRPPPAPEEQATYSQPHIPGMADAHTCGYGDEPF